MSIFHYEYEDLSKEWKQWRAYYAAMGLGESKTLKLIWRRMRNGTFRRGPPQ